MTEDTGIHSAWIGTQGARGDTGGAAAAARFPFWSFTKTAIAICALHLAGRGMCDLDAPLKEGHSLAQLLGHRAGLPDYAARPAYRRAVAAGGAPWSRDRLLAEVAPPGRLFAPGTGWAYSNIGYMLAVEHIEALAGASLGAQIAQVITGPLGLPGVKLARRRADFAALHWPAAARYDPGWVYHGCLTGTAPDAAALLHGLMGGRLLGPDMLGRMTEAHPLGGAIPGRPWTECGYGLGVMAGRMNAAGRVLGHSGGGPFCVNAVYHFPDARRPVTVASFAAGTDEGRVEAEVCRLAGEIA